MGSADRHTSALCLARTLHEEATTVVNVPWTDYCRQLANTVDIAAHRARRGVRGLRSGWVP